MRRLVQSLSALVVAELRVCGWALNEDREEKIIEATTEDVGARDVAGNFDHFVWQESRLPPDAPIPLSKKLLVAQGVLEHRPEPALPITPPNKFISFFTFSFPLLFNHIMQCAMQRHASSACLFNSNYKQANGCVKDV